MDEHDKSQDEWATIAERPGESESLEPLLATGQLVDHFRVIRLIGRGGMGYVYLSRDTRLGRKVALKVIRPRDGPKEISFVRQFIKEARTTAQFNHPHIVTIYEVGEFGGQPYLALEYLAGQTLRDRLRSSTPGMQESLRIGAAIASALAEAHRHGVLHLDLKPGNVMIPPDGRLRVLDFGLAQRNLPQALLSHTSISRSGPLTVGSHVMGTPRYMAPEQWKKEIPTSATDIWSLGIILYELVSGERPYQSEEMSLTTLAKAVGGPAPVPHLSSTTELAQLVERCLAKVPEDRPAAEEVAEGLLRMMSGPTRAENLKENPFRGLLAFTSRHAERFYGREREIAELVERLRDEPVLPVVGASGAGKSSLVKAGVIPRLTEQGRWLVFEMRPGLEPFKVLATRLTVQDRSTTSTPSISSRWDPGQAETIAAQLFVFPESLAVLLEQLAAEANAKVLLFVDQLEELFTLSDDEDRHHRFIRAISKAADDGSDPVRVVFTVRDDFLYRLAAAGPDVRGVLRRMMLLQVPEREALIDTLTKPVEAAGYRFEDDRIVNEMVDAVGHKPSSLPLLQFAAQMLWERRDEKNAVLTRKAYEDIGGVAGVLARHADRVLDGLIVQEGDVAKQILLRLVTPENTRRVVPQTDILEGLGPEAASVLSRLMHARLISSVRMREQQGKRQALELAHESLIQTWGRLRGWVDEDREELRFISEVNQAAELWERRGARGDEVWRGDALAEALRMRARIKGSVPTRVERFLQKGQQRSRQRGRRRRRWLTAGAAWLVVMMVVLWVQRHQALEQEKLAVSRGRQAEAERAEAQREAAAAALARGNVLEARAKLRTSLQTDDSTLARALWWRLENEPLIWRKRNASTAWQVRFSPDSQTIAAAMTDSSVHLYDVQTRSQHVLRAHKDQIAAVAFSPDGKFLATGSNDGALYLWDLETREIVRRLSGHKEPVRGLDFGTSQLLASGDAEGRLHLWDVTTGELKKTFQEKGDPIRMLSFHTDGRLLVAAGMSRIFIWNAETGASVVVNGHGNTVDSVQIGPDGKSFVSAGRDGYLRFWSAPDGRPLKSIAASGRTTSVSFSPDGRQVVSAGSKGDIGLYDVASGRLITTLTGHEMGVRSVQFSPDGRWLVSGSKTLRVWDARRASTFASAFRSSHTDGVVTSAFSLDARWVVSGGYDQTARVWDVASGRVVQVIDHHEGQIWSLDFQPGGPLMAIASQTVRLAELGGDRPTVLIQPRGEVVRAVRFGPMGKTLFVSGAMLRAYDVASRQAIGDFEVPPSHFVLGIDPSSDGRWIAGGLTDGTLRVWDASRRTLVKVLRGHESSDVWSVKFDATGQYLVSSGGDGTLRWWDWRAGRHRIVARHPSRIYWIDLSQDNQHIAASSADRRPRVWNVDGTGLAFEIAGHFAEVNTARVSPDNRYVATTADDGMLRMTELATGRPWWRAVALFASNQQVLTHEGWRKVGTSTVMKTKASDWQRVLTTDARRAVEIEGTSYICVLTEGQVQVWDRATDRRLRSMMLTDPIDGFGTERACVVRAADGVHLIRVNDDLTSLLVAGEVDAVYADRLHIAVAQGRTISRFDPSGRAVGTYQGNTGITALLVDDTRIWVGHRDGGISLAAGSTAPPVRVESFQDTPASPVTRMLLGPRRTVLVGFRSGVVGLWNLETQRHLQSQTLHGPIQFLARSKAQLFAASELGWDVVWDLSVFEESQCDLLRQVWGRVPVVWSGGRAVVRPPPDHACRSNEAPNPSNSRYKEG